MKRHRKREMKAVSEKNLKKREKKRREKYKTRSKKAKLRSKFNFKNRGM